MFVKIINGQPVDYSTDQLQRDNPNVSFPEIMNNERRAEWGVFPVSVDSPPTIDTTKQRRVKLPPVNQNGEWRARWAVEDIPLEEIESRARKSKSRAESELLFSIAVEMWQQINPGKTYEEAKGDINEKLRALAENRNSAPKPNERKDLWHDQDK